jgi:hypothetical protein
MEGGNTFNFVVNVDVIAVPCLSPFVITTAVNTPYLIELDSTTSTKMPLSLFTWTNPDATCPASSITVAFLTANSAINLHQASDTSIYEVFPTDYTAL